MAQENFILNLAAGNMFNATTNLAKTEVELMRYQQELRVKTAEGIESSQVSCYETGMHSAEENKQALDNEATGQEVGGIVGFIGGSLSFATMLPCKFGAGSTATKEELVNVNGFRGALPGKTKELPSKLPLGSVNDFKGTSEVDQELEEFDQNLSTDGASLTLNNRTPEIEARIARWCGNAEKAGDVRGFDNAADSLDRRAIDSLTPDELSTVEQNVLTRQRELEERLYTQAQGVKSNISQGAYSASTAASSFAQGVYNTDKAEYQALSSEYQTQNQIFQEDLNGLTSFANNAQQNADSYQQNSLSILANLNTQI